MDPGIENAARWGPGAALEGAEKKSLDKAKSTTSATVHTLPTSNADIELDGKIWPLVPDGEYLVRYLRHDTVRMFGTLKVFLHFEILDPGPYVEYWPAAILRELIDNALDASESKKGLPDIEVIHAVRGPIVPGSHSGHCRPRPRVGAVRLHGS